MRRRRRAIVEVDRVTYVRQSVANTRAREILYDQIRAEVLAEFKRDTVLYTQAETDLILLLLGALRPHLGFLDELPESLTPARREHIIATNIKACYIDRALFEALLAKLKS